MTKDDLHRMASRVLADYDARTPGELFTRPVHLTVPQSYELQSEIARLREQRGEKIVGYKIGCTSDTIQRQLGVSEPIFGRIFDTGCFRSGVRLSYAGYANLAVEGEMALRLSKDLAGSSPTVEECSDAVAAVFPVIELHHYVLHEAQSHGPELIASNGMHAGFVLPAEPLCSNASNLAHSLSIEINGVRVGAVENAAPLVRAGQAVRWLASRLAGIGLGLHEGQFILTGSCMPLFPVSLGGKIVVEATALGKSCAEIGP